MEYEDPFLIGLEKYKKEQKKMVKKRKMIFLGILNELNFLFV